MSEVRTGRTVQTPVTGGVMFSRWGQVHRLSADDDAHTFCGQFASTPRVAVTELQVLVHKLSACDTCYPFLIMSHLINTRKRAT